MATTVRNRVSPGGKQANYTPIKHLSSNVHSEKRSKKLVSIYWGAVFALFICVLHYIHRNSQSFPPALTSSVAGHQFFSEERARDFLSRLVDVGPRPVGSDANEKKAVNILLGEINKIKEQAKDSVVIQVDIQKASGSFSINFLEGFTSVYENIQNVIVKLDPSTGATDSLMLNCHYDSVIGAPG